MTEFVGTLNNAGWWNFLFLVLALLSIILAVYFYFKALRVRIPVFSQSSSQLVGARLARLDSLSILYDSQPVRSLSITTVAFWNRGRQHIELADFAPRDPLRISISDDAKLLDARLIIVPQPLNAVLLDVRREESAIYISFDYLGHNQGAVVEIFHTGTKGSEVKILGTVKDAGPFVRYRVKDYLFNACIESLFSWLPQPVSLKGPVTIFRNIASIALIMVAIAMFVPIAIVLVPIDVVIRWYRRPPAREFLLE